MRDNKITDISAELDNSYAADWTQQRKNFNEEVWRFYLDETRNN